MTNIQNKQNLTCRRLFAACSSETENLREAFTEKRHEIRRQTNSKKMHPASLHTLHLERTPKLTRMDCRIKFKIKVLSYSPRGSATSFQRVPGLES